MDDLPADPKRVLILHSGGIGDLLMAMPALRILRQKYPGSILELMGRPERLSLVAFDLQAQSIHSVDRGGMAYFYLDGEALPPDLSDFFASFDLVLLFGRSLGSALEENLKRAGAGRVMALPSFPPGGEGVHVSEYLLQVLKAAGIESDSPFFPLRLPGEALAFARTFRKANGLIEGEKVLAIHPGSGSPGKNWNPGNFARVADWASQRAKVFLISGPAEGGAKEVTQNFKKANPVSVDNFPLIHLAAILKSSTVYLGNDSGITHLSACLGVSTIAIFGPSNPIVWGPRGEAVKILYGGNPCSPCSSEVRSGCSHPCPESVEPDRVIETLAPFLESSL